MVNINKKMRKTGQCMKSKISSASPFRKKAQMKIQQMSFMLIAVFLFFGLVGMIMVTMKMNDIYRDASLLEEQNAVLLASKIANSPEFSCGEAFGNEKTDCVDFDKVMVLKDNINKYTNFWGVTNIEIRKIYPKWTEQDDTLCTKDNYPKCNLIKLISTSETAETGMDHANFVALCRKENYKGEIVNTCELAKIIIRYEKAGGES